jgi:uncharacterized membrane protein (UPF0127 family)
VASILNRSVRRARHRPGPIIVSSVALASILGCEPANHPVDGGTEQVTLGDRSFTLELAMAPASRTRGLGGRNVVPDDEGMLFVFPDAELRSFWMYDCLTAIDIAFVDPIGYVTAIHTMPAEPPRREAESDVAYRERLPGYSSRYRAQFAVELAPGMFESLGIREGDRLPIPADRLKTLAATAEPDE